MLHHNNHNCCSICTTTTVAPSTTTTTVAPSTTTTTVELAIPETVKIETKNVDCTIPGFVPKGYKKNYYELSTELGNNKPKVNPQMCILFTESIQNEWRIYHLDVMDKLIKYVGGYDRWTHIVYEPDDEGFEALDALDKFDFFYNNDSQKIEPSLQFVHEQRSCLSGFARKNLYDLNEFSMCIQPNPLTATSPDWIVNDREVQGIVAFQMGILVNGISHEYYHHVQRAHTFGRSNAMPDDCCGLNNPTEAPAWYVEGQAIVFPSLFIRDNFDDLQIVKDNGFEGACNGDPEIVDGSVNGEIIKQAGCNLTQKYMEFRKEVIGESGFGECRGFTNKEEYRHTSICSYRGWEMMNFYIAYITSFETLFINFHEDIYELSFPGTLKKYTGMNSEELYLSFNKFINDNPTPPEGFFPEVPLNQLVDFWSIDSS